MAYTSWRGVVGLVKPTRRPGSLEELIRMLPEGVGLVPFLLNVRGGTLKEFQSAIPFYEEKVKELAADGVDMIICSGTPPFMLLGTKGEARLVRSWERKYKTTIFSQGMTHARALRAVGIKKFIPLCKTRSSPNTCARPDSRSPPWNPSRCRSTKSAN
jgi:maleate cis-trans isomerase